jgi:hypothetical protein
MLAIDGKTLRQWLKQSNLSTLSHPSDARIKCLTVEQVQPLAALHARRIASQATAVSEPPDVPAPLVPPEAVAPLPSESPVTPRPSASRVPSTSLQEGDLRSMLVCLETTVATLQQQVTQLALALLHERDQRYEHRLSTLEALVRQTVSPSASQQGIAQSVCDHQSRRRRAFPLP